MNAAEPFYRRRNIALGVVAGLVVIGAVFRMFQAAQPVPVEGAATPVTATAAPAGGAQARAATAPITLEVTYAGAVDALPAAAKVYVFVRPVGERMPLGVQTFGVHELPLAVEFTGTTEAAASQTVEVVARLSMSGAVALQPGDLEAVSSPLQFGASQAVRLTLGTSGMSSAAAPQLPASTAVAATAQSTATEAVLVPVHLSLGGTVRLPPTTTVFLIVRPSDGTPMPLAVKRLTVADLPTVVTLSDTDSMVPGRSLSGAGSVEIVARASLSGNVKAQSGDYEARSGTLHTADLSAPVVLVIDQPL